jgi:hypothetical protein
MGKLCSKKQLADFAQEERDFEWAIQMEQRISDFIVTHELAYTVLVKLRVMKKKRVPLVIS